MFMLKSRRVGFSAITTSHAFKSYMIIDGQRYWPLMSIEDNPEPVEEDVAGDAPGKRASDLADNANSSSSDETVAPSWLVSSKPFGTYFLDTIFTSYLFSVYHHLSGPRAGELRGVKSLSLSYPSCVHSRSLQHHDARLVPLQTSTRYFGSCDV